MRAPTRVFWILEISNTRWNNVKDYSRRSWNAFSYIGCMKPLPSDNKVRLSAETSAVNTRSEGPLSALAAESQVFRARAPWQFWKLANQPTYLRADH